MREVEAERLNPFDENSMLSYSKHANIN